MTVAVAQPLPSPSATVGGTRRMRLADCLDEITTGVGGRWADYPVLGATRAGLAPAKEPVGKQPERYKLVEQGTIFYNPMRILLGSIALVDDEDAPGVTSPDYVVFKTRPGVLHFRWFYYWLRSAWGETFIKSLTRGAVRERLLFKRLAPAEIDVPPWEAQVEFARQLPAIRRARAAVLSQLDAANALPAAYLRRVFEGAEAQAWPVVRLDDVAETCSGATPSRSEAGYYGGSIPWVKTGELRDGWVDDTEEHVTDKAVQETALSLLPSGTLLIAMYGQGQTRGRTGRLCRAATTNQACFAVLPRPDVFNTAFVQLWFRYSYARLRRETEGRGGNQPNLNGIVLRNQRMPLPSLGSQSRIVGGFERVEADFRQLARGVEAQLAALDALPAALLRKAFAGKL